MNRKTRVGVTREDLLKMRGGKLISVEAYALAIVVFFILIMVKNASLITSLIIAAAVGFVFPIVVGIFKSLAWLAAVLFSIVWAILAYAFIGTILSGSVLVSIVSGIIFFFVSFFVHKNYSGLTFQGVSKKTNNQQVVSVEEPVYENVKFCPKCGRRIRALDGKCDFCDR